MEEALVLERYVGRLKQLGFQPQWLVEEVQDADGKATSRRATVTFGRRGGLPGPIPAGADFRPRGIGKRDARTQARDRRAWDQVARPRVA